MFGQGNKLEKWEKRGRKNKKRGKNCVVTEKEEEKVGSRIRRNFRQNK